jgi:hypothetical protein
VGEDDRGDVREGVLAAGEEVAEPVAEDLGVVEDRDAALVEAGEVEVALLVERPAGEGAAHASVTSRPCSARTSAASRPSQPPPQSATRTGPAMGAGVAMAAHASTVSTPAGAVAAQVGSVV